MTVQRQLAYWALLSASIFFLCGLRVRLHLVWQLLFSASVLYLVLISLSRAAFERSCARVASFSATFAIST